MKRWLIVAAVLLAGCGSHADSSSPSRTPAETLCRATVPQPDQLWRADPTTVGAARAAVGAAPTPLFPGLAPSQFAAKCWTRLGSNGFQIYKAAGKTAVLVAGPGVDPAGRTSTT